MRTRSGQRHAARIVIPLLAVCLALPFAGKPGRAFFDIFENSGTAAPEHDFPRLRSKRDANKNGISDTDDVIPGDRENLAGRQPGDIVTFTNPDHIAILSDRRNARAFPFCCTTTAPWPRRRTPSCSGTAGASPGTTAFRATRAG